MNDLDKLKSLLFGDEKQALDSITRRIERREARAEDVADILPEAIHQSHRRGGDLAASLKRPVTECLKQAIHEDPEAYGDALYPVMGPAIRKSIMEALRAFAQQINAAVENSITPGGLRWRFQAWRAGIPFGEFVLQKTLLYRVEQVYLISRENGLLVAHVHHDAARIRDSDAVSAMFTAIQDFVKESFSPDRTGRLESADMGEFTLWAVHGPHALLVCVIRGVPPRDLRGELSAVLERVHFRYGEAIRTYSGDTATVDGVEEEIDQCLGFEARQEKPSAGRWKSVPLLILLIALLATAGYLLAARWATSQRLAALTDALASTPGIYVADVVVDGDRFVLRGMRDPLATPIEDVVESIGIDAGDVILQVQPFQSLAPELVARRAATLFGRPGGVDYGVSDSILFVEGPSSPDWQQRVRDGIGLLAGADSVDFRMSAVDRVRVVRDWLSPPAGVIVDADAAGIVLTGSAPAAWIDGAERRLGAIDAAWNVSIEGLRATERLELEAELDSLSAMDFFFIDGARLAAGREDELRGFVERLASLRERVAGQELAIVVTLTGYTDGIGDPTLNERLAARRTQAVAELLAQSGHDPQAIIQLHVTADGEAGSEVDLNLRRVSTALRLVETPADR